MLGSSCFYRKIAMATYTYFPAEERGHANHGWLDTYYSFSFASYYNPQKLGFGALRVLNDDVIEPGKGFGMHSHMNMEIVTIPLRGELEHGDNLGHTQAIASNEVQVMSAGTGIFHSEFNASRSNPVSLLQLWIFPRANDLEPRYAVERFDREHRKNTLQLVAGPDRKATKTWINQDAWVYLVDLSEGTTLTYELNKPSKNAIFIFTIEGSVKVGERVLKRRDAVGISNLSSAILESQADSEVLVIEIPKIS